MPELPINTDHFNLTDEVFTGVSSLVTQAEIDLINSSDLLLSLLHTFKDKGLSLAKDNEGNGYDGSQIALSQSGSGFVRILGHELGHFYDHQPKGDTDVLKIPNQGAESFDDIIKYEMNESQATAISFIIRQQIKLAAGGTDIYISNRIDWFDPDGNESEPAYLAAIADLESRFGGMITPGMNISDCWALACVIANDIWGKNFLTRPRQEETQTNRWQDRRDELNDAYTENGKEIPEFLQDSQRTFKSADFGLGVCRTTTSIFEANSARKI